MSKKTRKKSPKTPSGKVAGAAAKKPAAAVGRSAAKTKTGKSVSKPVTASHTAPSKKLKGGVAETRAPRKASEAKAQAPVKSAPFGEGAKAPAFQLQRDGGQNVSLSDYHGRKLVIFFYPRADTPGCTKEAIDFTRLGPAFADSQTDVVGISADPLPAQESFRDKHQLSIPLASDETKTVLQAYGAWGEKSMYGRTFLGILRTTVLIGADGKIARIWRNVKVDGHADEVLAAARAL
jgi:peroxiredoxin Q/BCP